MHLIALLALLGVAGVVAPAAAAQQLEPRPGLASLDSGATGVFVIGAIEVGQVEASLVALVYNGHILQVHSQRAGTWLAKHSGSRGGKAIAPTTFDELVAIARGVDADVRCLPAGPRAEFARVAGVLPFDSAAGCHHSGTATLGRAANRTVSPGPITIAEDCTTAGCRTVFRHGGSRDASFLVALGLEQATWSFEGYGIVAVWSIPGS